MNWQEFILKLEKDFRLNETAFQNRTGINRSIIYGLKKGHSLKPRQATIRRIEEGLQIKIDDSDPQNVFYNQNLFDKNLELFNIRGNDFPIISRLMAPTEIFTPQNIIGTISMPYNKKNNCFSVYLFDDNIVSGAIKRGDKILADIDAKIENNSLVICRLKSGMTFIKHIRLLPQGLVQFYLPNTTEEPLTLTQSEIEFNYRVVVVINYL